MANKRIQKKQAQSKQAQEIKNPKGLHSEIIKANRDMSWFAENIARTLNPAKLASLLQETVEEYSSEYLTLAEEMEEKDPHYAGVLGVRKRAISRLTACVEPVDESAEAKKHAELLEQVIENPDFETMVYDLTDAIGKGYAAVEIMWQTSGGVWIPQRYEWRDPRHFRFDKETSRRLLIHRDMEDLELPPYKFVVHIPRQKSGIPIRGGIARLVAVSYMCKQFILSDWLAFLDMYGSPIRIGRYGPDATEEDVGTLRGAVARIGVDGGAVIPKSMDIEFHKMTDGRSSASEFRQAAEWIDRQVSKGVLGQTMTSDDGSSQAQANIHNDVRLDILEADANEIQNTLNSQLVKPIVDLNFGVQEEYPRIIIQVPRPANLELLAEALGKLVPLGLKVDQREILEKFGLSMPEKDAPLLQAPMQAMPQETESNRVEMNAQQEREEESEYNHWTHIPEQMVRYVERVSSECASVEELREKLNEVPELNSEQTESLAMALLTARLGDAPDG